MAAINITKIYVEQNKGFFKEIDNPHIQSSVEIPARFDENQDLVLTIRGVTIDGEIYNSQERQRRNLPTNNLSNLKSVQKKILETKHVVIPLIINDETNESEMRSFTNYVSTFKRNIETRAEYGLQFESEKVEQIDSTNNTEVTKREYSTIIKIKREPRNLYLLFGSYHIVQVASSSGYKREIRFEKISYQTIFERGELKTEVDVYHLENGQLWYGAVIKTDKNLLFTSEKNARRLFLKKALNTKLIDLRILSNIERRKQNFRQQNENLLNSRIREVQKRRNNFYFSDIFINQKNRIASCFFFFNDRNFILDNCLLSRIYETIPENLKDLLVLNSKIINFKIYRRRVKKNGNSKNKLSITNETYEIFENEKEELIAESRQENNNPSISSLQNLQEFYSMNFDINQMSRMFKFQDTFYQNKNEGLYQYKVEIEIDDYSIEIIKADIKVLYNILKELKSYSDMQVAIENNARAPNIRSLQHERADFYLNNYFNILNRYFINDDLFNQNQIFKIKQSLKAQIVSSSREPRGILNFSKLIGKLITDLSQFISLELFSFDDPHIDLDLNQVEKNSKRTITITNYFSNNVVDASITKIKNVNFFPSINQLNYDEFNISQFSNFLTQMNNAKRIKQDKILPYSVTQGQFGVSLNAQKTEYQNDLQSTKNKRQNLLNNNLNISVVQYENNNFQEVENEENYLYRQDINSFFDYISFNLVQDKTIDETSQIFKNTENRLLSQFEGEIQILSSTSLKSGTWINLRDLPTMPSEYGNYLICKIKPKRGDSRNRNWDSLKNVTCTDAYFFITISSREEAIRLSQSIKSIMPILNISPSTLDNGSRTILRQKASNLSSRTVENFFFR